MDIQFFIVEENVMVAVYWVAGTVVASFIWLYGLGWTCRLQNHLCKKRGCGGGDCEHDGVMFLSLFFWPVILCMTLGWMVSKGSLQEFRGQRR